MTSRRRWLRKFCGNKLVGSLICVNDKINYVGNGMWKCVNPICANKFQTKSLEVRDALRYPKDFLQKLNNRDKPVELPGTITGEPEAIINPV